MRHEFRLRYQPIVRLSDERVVGAEALLRWAPPGHPEIGADRFVPAAVANGAIVPMGAWVIREAVEQVQQWHAEGLAQPLIGINIAAAQLAAPDFAEEMADVLATTSFDARHLCLELTETAPLDPTDSTTRVTLQRLRGLGVRLALDDFGTGYSSLSYLKHLPIDICKIDRSFVAELDTSSRDEAIVEAAVSLSAALSLDVIAEGVERRSQAQILRRLRCGYAQGFLWSPAVPAQEFLELARADPYRTQR